MIQTNTILNVADNSGAKQVKCIKVFSTSKYNYAKVGDLIVVSIQKTSSKKKVNKGEVAYAVIVRTKKKINRLDGTSLSFSDNAVVLVNNNTFVPIGTRIFGPITQELRKRKFMKIIALASVIV